VDSAVVVFTPLPEEKKPAHPDWLARLIKLCFQQRRKQLQTILRHAEPQRFTPEILAALGIEGTQRPETLTVLQFQQLAEALFSEK
jgi:16S rRNA (adenine1518-N6/adenine1519-N6)-dimethyltransferase